jgi:hypothetical protein
MKANTIVHPLPLLPLPFPPPLADQPIVKEFLAESSLDSSAAGAEAHAEETPSQQQEDSAAGLGSMSASAAWSADISEVAEPELHPGLHSAGVGDTPAADDDGASVIAEANSVASAHGPSEGPIDEHEEDPELEGEEIGGGGDSMRVDDDHSPNNPTEEVSRGGVSGRPARSSRTGPREGYGEQDEAVDDDDDAGEAADGDTAPSALEVGDIVYMRRGNVYGKVLRRLFNETKELVEVLVQWETKEPSPPECMTSLGVLQKVPKPLPMALRSGLVPVISLLGQALPDIKDIVLEDMTPIAFHPAVNMLEGMYFTRGLGRHSVVVFGNIFARNSSGESVLVLRLGDIFAQYSHTGTGNLVRNDIHFVFRGLAVPLDAKPRLGKGAASPSQLRLDAACLLGTRFKVANTTRARHSSSSPKDLLFMDGTSNSLVHDFKGAEDGSSPALQHKTLEYIPSTTFAVSTAQHGNTAYGNAFTKLLATAYSQDALLRFQRECNILKVNGAAFYNELQRMLDPAASLLPKHLAPKLFQSILRGAIWNVGLELTSSFKKADGASESVKSDLVATMIRKSDEAKKQVLSLFEARGAHMPAASVIDEMLAEAVREFQPALKTKSTVQSGIPGACCACALVSSYATLPTLCMYGVGAKPPTSTAAGDEASAPPRARKVPSASAAKATPPAKGPPPAPNKRAKASAADEEEPAAKSKSSVLVQLMQAAASEGADQQTIAAAKAVLNMRTDPIQVDLSRPSLATPASTTSAKSVGAASVSSSTSSTLLSDVKESLEAMMVDLKLTLQTEQQQKVCCILVHASPSLASPRAFGSVAANSSAHLYHRLSSSTLSSRGAARRSWPFKRSCTR